MAKIGHQVRSINNITRYDTKQPLPLFLIELEPKNSSKDIFKIKKVLNTIVTVKRPRHKKDRNAYSIYTVSNMDTRKIIVTEARHV